MTLSSPEGAVDNCLLVVLDTARAQSTSFAGRDTTPRLEELSTVGTAFERAIAPAPWTLPSHASMYTGRYPTEHGATHQYKWLDDTHTTLPEQINEAGVRTGLFTANMFLTESFNMARGFDEIAFIREEDNKLFDAGLNPIQFINEREHDSGFARFQEIGQALADGPVVKNVANALYYKLSHTYRRYVGTTEPSSWDEQAVDAARSFMSQTVSNEERFFEVVNLIGAHGPWEFERDYLEAIGIVPEEIAPIDRWRSVASNSEAQWPYAAGEIDFDEADRTILTALYESWVHRVDELAGRLIDHLDELGVLEETLIIVTADHGECIARDGVLGHELTVDESVAHVPLVIAGPDIPTESVTEPVSLKDLYGTILTEMGVQTDARHLWDDDARGMAYIETSPVDPDTVSEAYRDAARRFGRRHALFTSDGWAERREDDDELLGDEAIAARLDAFSEELTVYSPAGEDSDGDLSADVEDRLEDLGYKA